MKKSYDSVKREIQYTILENAGFGGRVQVLYNQCTIIILTVYKLIYAVNSIVYYGSHAELNRFAAYHHLSLHFIW